MRYCLLFAALLFLVVGCSSAVKLPEDPDKLIDLLARTNGDYAPKEAMAAYKKLVSMNITAFPALIDKSDDERPACQCFGFEIEGGETTVGMVCASIIRGQVDVELYKGSRDLGFLGSFPSKEKLTKWWQERSGKTLKELQIESARYTLETATSSQSLSEEGKKWAIERATARLKELGVDK